MKTLQRVGYCLLIAMGLIVQSQAHAEQIKVFFNRAYKVPDDIKKRKVNSILKDVVNKGLEIPKYTIDIEWLQYDGAMDITLDNSPSFGIITTGMYSLIQYNTKKNSGIKILGVVNKFGTTTYKYFLLAKHGTELKPDIIKGKIVMKKKQSLSGSIFPFNYLIENYGFDKRLLTDDRTRAEWGTTQRFHKSLAELEAETASHLVYFGEGLSKERIIYESNGWDVYPKLNEDESKFDITRSVVITRNIGADIAARIQIFFLTHSEERDYILRTFGIDGIEAIDNADLSRVVDRYTIIFAQSGFDELWDKVEKEIGLYMLAFALMMISHLLFRYKIAAEKDNWIWVLLTLILKFSFFVVSVWYLPANALYFIPSAIVIGAMEKGVILKLFQKTSGASV